MHEYKYVDVIASKKTIVQDAGLSATKNFKPSQQHCCQPAWR
jgi:hypothetical protein